MARSSSKSLEPGSYLFPATQGTGSGIVGLALVVLLVVVIAVDGWGLSGLRVQIGLVIFGVLTWALMLHPKIRVTGGRLVLVNPFHVLSVPLHQVDFVEVRSVTKVHVGTRTLVGIAVGRKTRALARPSTMGAFSGPFALRRGDDGGPAPGSQTADLLEEWVNRAAVDARRDAKRTGVPDADEQIRRRPNVELYVVLGVLVLALVVTLFL